MQPPLALTTLAAAVQLRGDHCISAIRIRVAGVETASEQSWKRVQQVAGEITQQTHLQVVVTLGSSPHPTLVSVPGVKKGQFGATQDIEPVGWVEERWIATGVSIFYLQQLGTTRLLLISAVLVVCLGYLIMTLSTLAASQRRDSAILSALGWRPWQPAQIFLKQALLLSLVGGIIGMGIALLVVKLLDAVPLWPIVGWTLPLMIGMAFVSSLYPLWQLWHLRPATILRTGSTVSEGRRGRRGIRLGSLFSPLGTLGMSTLIRSWPRTLLTVTNLFLSTMLLVLMVRSVLTIQQSLQGSLLGTFVLLQTAVPQLAGCGFAVLLTFLSVADLLLLRVRERRREIGLLQAVGWRPKMVQRLFVQEGIMLALLSAPLGVLVAQGILVIQHIQQQWLPALLVALGAIFLIVSISALAAIPALRAVSRMQVADVLRAE